MIREVLERLAGKMDRCRTLSLMTLVVVSAFSHLCAGNFYFTGEGDGHSWNLKNNWRSGSATGNHALPSYGDTVIIDPGEGENLFLATSNTTESTAWPCHRVYKFMSGTTYIDRKHVFYYHGGADTDPQIYVAAGATVVLSNSVTVWNGGPMRKTGGGTFIQVGTTAATSSAPTGPKLDIQEGAWLMKCSEGYGAYCQNSNLFVRSGATLLVQGFNSMSDKVKATVEEGGTLILNSMNGEVKIGSLVGAGTVIKEPGASAPTNLKLTFDRGPCDFTGIISNITTVTFAPSAAAREAGSFSFTAGGDTFRWVASELTGVGNSLVWASGVSEAFLPATTKFADGAVVQTRTLDGEPVKVSASLLNAASSKSASVSGGGELKATELKLADKSTVLTIEDGLVYGGMTTDAATSSSVLKVPNKVAFNVNDQVGTVKVKGGELVFASSNNGSGGFHRMEVLGGRVVQGVVAPASFATVDDPTTVLIDGGSYLGRSTQIGDDNYRYSSTIFNASDAFRVEIGAKGATFGCGYGVHEDSVTMYFASSLRTATDLETTGTISLLPQWVTYKFAAPILANGPVDVLGGIITPSAVTALQSTPDYFGTGTLTLDSTVMTVGSFASTATLNLAGGSESQLVYRNAPCICLRKEAGKAAQQVVVGASAAAANSVLRRARKGSVLTLWDNSLNLGQDGYSSVIVNGGVPVDADTGLVKEPVFISNGTAEYFTTYDVDKGFVQFAGTVDNLNGGKDSVAVVGTSSVAANTTKEVAAVKVNTWGTLTINAGATLKVGNGTDPAKVILQASTITGAGTLDFGTSEGVIMGGANPNPNTINAKITGSGGITFAATPNYGYRYFNIGGNNTYSGGTWINVARVDVRSATAFGTGDVWVCGDERNGGRVRFDRPVTIENDFHLSGWGARQNEWGDQAYASGYGTTKAELGALVFPTNGITLTGNIELIGQTRIGATKGETGVSAELTGVISGGGIEAHGIDGRVLFANDNTYTGGTIIHNGKLYMGRSGSFGTGVVTLDNGTLVFENVAPLVFTNKLLGVGKIAMAGSAPVTFATDLTKATLDGTLDILGEVQPFLGTIPFAAVTSSTGRKTTIEFAANLGTVKWGGVTIDYDKMLLTVKSGTTLDLEGATLDVWRLTVEDGAAVINGTVNESHPKCGLILIVR